MCTHSGRIGTHTHTPLVYIIQVVTGLYFDEACFSKTSAQIQNSPDDVEKPSMRLVGPTRPWTSASACSSSVFHGSATVFARPRRNLWCVSSASASAFPVIAIKNTTDCVNGHERAESLMNTRCSLRRTFKRIKNK